MLPPIDAAVLAANPKFDALYRDLCTNKLEQEGTTKLDAKSQREHDSLQDQVSRSQLDGYRRELLCNSLQHLLNSNHNLPDDVGEGPQLLKSVLTKSTCSFQS